MDYFSFWNWEIRKRNHTFWIKSTFTKSDEKLQKVCKFSYNFLSSKITLASLCSEKLISFYLYKFKFSIPIGPNHFWCCILNFWNKSNTIMLKEIVALGCQSTMRQNLHLTFGTIHLRRQHVLGGEGCSHVPMVQRSQYIRIKNPLHKHFAGMPMVGG